jgi:hypothetical protein
MMQRDDAQELALLLTHHILERLIKPKGTCPRTLALAVVYRWPAFEGMSLRELARRQGTTHRSIAKWRARFLYRVPTPTMEKHPKGIQSSQG